MTADPSSALPADLVEVLDHARPLADRFAAAGHRLYLVGGIVRDHLLGRPRAAQDLDATTDARPERIKELVTPLADALWTQGERFGTIGCRVGGQIYEITTHRAEAYDDHSRKPTVAFGDRIEDDLARRDFTVNAMAVEVVAAALVDPHGGAADLSAGVLRTPLDPKTAFSEDPLRMLRAARFHAGYDLTPVPELVAAIATMADRMAIVSAERIRDELEKLLLLDDPAPGLVLLAETGLLRHVLAPRAGLDAAAAAELGRLVAAVAADPGCRWAVLLHGPPPGGAVGRDDLQALRFSNRLATDVLALRETVARGLADPGGVDDAPRAAREEAVRARRLGRPIEEHLALVRSLREARGLGTDDVDRLSSRVASLRELEPDLDDPQPPLTGEQVCQALGVEPGPVVGEALAHLRAARLHDGPFDEAEARRRLAAWWEARA